MDLTITPAKPRSLFRRVFPWAASLGLFSGGGYGVYHFAAPQGAGASVPEAASAEASSSGFPSNPFASRAATAPTASFGNRYTSAAGSSVSLASAPELPPAQEEQEVATPRSAAAVTSSVSPLATTPVGDGGGKYTSAPAAADPFAAAADATPPASAAGESSIPVASHSVDSAAVANDDDSPEVARGQEPEGANPLRSSTPQQTTAADAGTDDARAAFTDQSPQHQPLNLGAAPRSADPLKQAAGAAAVVAGSRYVAAASQGEATVASPTGKPLSGASAFPLASEPSPLAAAQAAPRQATPEPGYGAQGASAASSPSAPLSQAPAAGQSFADMAAGSESITPTPGIAATDGTGRPGERILEGVQTPQLTVQKLAPPEIQVGKKCTFAIRVTNGSQRTIHNVVVRDEVPLNTQLVGAAPRAVVNGSAVSWDLGTLSAGEERVVEMELMPTDEGELGSVATVMFAAQASAKARCTRPQLALRLSASPRVMIGQQQLVEVEVSNPGSGDATGVMLLETIPQGVSHEAGPALEFEIGTLKAGDSRRLELVLTAEQAGQINNIMTAKADANLQVQANCEFEIVAPDLKVTIEGPQKRFLERPATYTVNVDNPGTASAKEVQLVTQLPRGMQFVSANNMGEYDAATHSVYWSLAELPANERGSVELTTLPIEPGEHTLQIATRAQQGLEDRAETRVTVEGLVALSFEVTAADGAIEVGGETSYEIRVMNQGSKAAANVQVVAIMPPGLRATAGQGETRNVVDGNRVSFAPLAQLAPKSEAKFRIQVQGLRAGDQRARVQVTTDEVQEPITKEQSTRVYADE